MPVQPSSETIETTESSRRSSAQVRELILASARRLFASRGFTGVGTRDIAADAGVTPAAIFRHFGSKEGLFEQSIEGPYHACITECLRQWQSHPPDPASTTEVTRIFMRSFYDLLRANRELFLAYLLTPPNALGRDGAAHESVLSRELSGIVEHMRAEVDRRGITGVDVPVAVRCAAGLVFALALHEDVLFPPGPAHPDPDRVIEEAVAFSLRGIEGRGPH